MDHVTVQILSDGFRCIILLVLATRPNFSCFGLLHLGMLDRTKQCRGKSGFWNEQRHWIAADHLRLESNRLYRLALGSTCLVNLQHLSVSSGLDLHSFARFVLFECMGQRLLSHPEQLDIRQLGQRVQRLEGN